MRVTAASVMFLTEKRDVARRFMKAYHESIEWVYANPEKDAAFYAGFAKITPQIAKQTHDIFPRASVAGWPVKGLKKNLQEAVENRDAAMLERESKRVVTAVEAGTDRLRS